MAKADRDSTMSAPFTPTLGELRVTGTLKEDPVLPCVRAVHPDGRGMRVRALPAVANIGAEALTAFESAARGASVVEHPSLAAPRLWSTSPIPFVAVDAIDGVSLEELAAPMTWESAVAIGCDVAEALEAAHAAGVVHGGVGAAAIVVARPGRAVLADFGIAGLAGRLANAHSQLLGSVAPHLVPEQLENQPIGPSADVFALGSTLYRLLAGTYPFDAPSPMGMTLKLSMGVFDRVEERAPATPTALAEIVHRMLASSPAERPTAREVASALSELSPRERARREVLLLVLPAEASPPDEVAVDAPVRSESPPGAPALGGSISGAMALAHPADPSGQGATPPSAPPASPPVERSAADEHALHEPPGTEADAMEWVESSRFDDAATEFTPELEAAIERDAGIANPVLIRPSTRERDPLPSPPTRSPRPRATGSDDRVLLYVAVAVGALVLLIGAVLGAIALGS